jgi:hypothetical protein
LRIASICRAEKILALLLLCAGLHLVSNALSNVQFGQPLVLKSQCELQTVADIECFEQFDLLCEIQIRGVAGCIR